MANEYYKKGNFQTINVIEDIVSRSDNCVFPAKVGYCLGQAAKYLGRVGVKEGVPWTDDAIKAMDYLHRALTEVWMSDKDKEILESLICPKYRVAISESLTDKYPTPTECYNRDEMCYNEPK